MEKSLFEKKKIVKYVDGNVVNKPIERIVPPIQRTAAQQRAISAAAPKISPLPTLVDPPRAVLPVDRAFSFDGSTHLSTALTDSSTSWKLQTYVVYCKIAPQWTGDNTAQTMTIYSLGTGSGATLRQYSLQIVREDIGGGVYKDFLYQTSVYGTNVSRYKRLLVNQNAEELRLSVRADLGTPWLVFENGKRNKYSFENLINEFRGPSGWYHNWRGSGNTLTIGANYDSTDRDYFSGLIHDFGIFKSGYLDSSNKPYYLTGTITNGYGFDFQDEDDPLESVIQRHASIPVTLTVNGTETFNPPI